MKPFSLFGQARAGLPLTPGERAYLKLVQGVAITGLIAAIQAAGPLLNQQQPDLAAILHTALIAFGVSVVHAIWKLASAQGDVAATLGGLIAPPPVGASMPTPPLPPRLPPVAPSAASLSVPPVPPDALPA